MKKRIRVLCFLLAFIFVIGAPLEVSAEMYGADTDDVPDDSTNYVSGLDDSSASASLSDVSITASAAMAIDYDTGEIYYSKNADNMMVPASLTKIMTAYIIYQEIENGTLSKDTQVTISSTAASMSRNSDYPMAVPLTKGASYSVDTLLKLIMIPSASASCYAMAEHISGSESAFVQRMNDTAAQMGLDSQFTNCHGAKVHYTTARTIVSLIRTFIQEYPDILNYTSLKSVTFNGTTYNNTNKLLSSYYYEGADGFKTGTIAASGYCLSATAVRNGHRIITVVLNSSSTETRHTDSAKLLDYGFVQAAARDNIRRDTSLTFSSVPTQIRRNSDFTLKVSLDNIGTDYSTDGASWSINDTHFKSENAFTATNGKTFSYTTYLPSYYNSDTVKITFYLNAGFGINKEVTINIPVSMEEPALYRDVDGNWAESIIEDLSSLGIMVGYGNGYFGTNSSITRAQFVKVMANLAENHDISTSTQASDHYTDVLIGSWYYEVVSWATEQGLAEGYGSKFGPDDQVTREQIAVFMYRFLEKYDLLLTTGENKSFTDKAKISSWAITAVEAMTAMQIINGYPEGDFRPQNDATRAECASILSNFLTAEAIQPEPEVSADPEVSPETFPSSELSISA